MNLLLFEARLIKLAFVGGHLAAACFGLLCAAASCGAISNSSSRPRARIEAQLLHCHKYDQCMCLWFCWRCWLRDAQGRLGDTGSESLLLFVLLPKGKKSS